MNNDGLEVRRKLDTAIGILESLPVFPSLTWLWAWDSLQAAYGGPEVDALWEKFWETAETEGWTMEYGSESMHDHVLDFLIKHNFYIDEEGEGA